MKHTILKLALASCALFAFQTQSWAQEKATVKGLSAEVEVYPLIKGHKCEETADDINSAQMCSVQKTTELVMKNIKYPKTAKDQKKEGLAIVSFQIDKNGKAHSAKIVKDPGAGMGEAALKAVQKVCKENKWKPARGAGDKPVESELVIPVQFKL